MRASTSAVQFHAEHLQVTEYLLQHFTFTPQQLRQTRRTALSEWWTALRQGSPLHLSQAWPIIHTARHLGASHQLRMLFWQMMSHLRARVRNIG